MLFIYLNVFLLEDFVSERNNITQKKACIIFHLSSQVTYYIVTSKKILQGIYDKKKTRATISDLLYEKNVAREVSNLILKAVTHGPNIGWYQPVQQKRTDILPICTAACSTEAGLTSRLCRTGMLEGQQLIGIRSELAGNGCEP